jgi:hypothetical protein
VLRRLAVPKGDLGIVKYNLKMRALYGPVLDNLDAEWSVIDGSFH